MNIICSQCTNKIKKWCRCTTFAQITLLDGYYDARFLVQSYLQKTSPAVKNDPEHRRKPPLYGGFLRVALFSKVTS